MQLHELKRYHANKNPKPRVGQGGRRGTTAGRGTKGQRSRSGHRIRPAERDYIQRLPKLRGHRNTMRPEKLPALNVGDLARILPKGGEISEKTLGRRVKILGNGTVNQIYAVSGLAISKSAKEKIEKAGGKIS